MTSTRQQASQSRHHLSTGMLRVEDSPRLYSLGSLLVIRRIHKLVPWATARHSKDVRWVLLISIRLNKGVVPKSTGCSILNKAEFRYLLINADHSQMVLNMLQTDQCHLRKDECNSPPQAQIRSSKVVDLQQTMIIRPVQRSIVLTLVKPCDLIRVLDIVDRMV